MKRKVIQIANSTQLVSLPRKWALQHNIKKGDELEIEEQGNKIIVTTGKQIELARANIDITGLDRTSILYYFEILYRLGYDEINVVFNEPVTTHLRVSQKEKVISIIDYVVTRLIGMEIIQQGEKSCLIKSLQEMSNKEFETALRRIFLILNDMTNDFIEGAKKGNVALLETIEDKHDSIAKFISYCLRSLNKIGYPEPRKITVLYHIIANLDKLTDIFKYAARDLIAYKKLVRKDTLAIIEKIKRSVFWYYELYYKFDLHKIRELYENRDDVIKQIKKISKSLPFQEALLLQYMEHVLEFLVDLTESRLGLEH